MTFAKDVVFKGTVTVKNTSGSTKVQKPGKLCFAWVVSNSSLKHRESKNCTSSEHTGSGAGCWSVRRQNRHFTEFGFLYVASPHKKHTKTIKSLIEDDDVRYATKACRCSIYESFMLFYVCFSTTFHFKDFPMGLTEVEL